MPIAGFRPGDYLMRAIIIHCFLIILAISPCSPASPRIMLTAIIIFADIFGKDVKYIIGHACCTVLAVKSRKQIKSWLLYRHGDAADYWATQFIFRLAILGAQSF